MILQNAAVEVVLPAAGIAACVQFEKLRPEQCTGPLLEGAAVTALSVLGFFGSVGGIAAVAAGIKAPELSCTVPEEKAIDTCAKAPPADKAKNSTSLMMPPLY